MLGAYREPIRIAREFALFILRWKDEVIRVGYLRIMPGRIAVIHRSTSLTYLVTDFESDLEFDFVGVGGGVLFLVYHSRPE